MINQKRIEALLQTAYFGRYLYVLPEVDSTNTFARNEAKAGAPEGSVIIADYQTSGRGTRGRLWEATRGKNILMTIILRPRIDITKATCITLATATILIKAISTFLIGELSKEPDIEVKWPNDILLNGGKVAGILTESSVVNHKVEYLLVGMGINVNQDRRLLSPELRNNANAMIDVSGGVIEREQLIAHILMEFERRYIEMERSHYCNVIPEWKKYWRMRGAKVQIQTPLKNESAEIVDINPRGILIYKTESGEIKELNAGIVITE